MKQNRYCHYIWVDYDDDKEEDKEEEDEEEEEEEKDATFYLNCQNKVHRYKTRVK